MKSVSYLCLAGVLLGLLPWVARAQTVNIGTYAYTPTAPTFSVSQAGSALHTVLPALQSFTTDAAGAPYFQPPTTNIPLFCVELTQYSNTNLNSYVFQPIVTAFGATIADELQRLYSSFFGGTYDPLDLNLPAGDGMSATEIEAFQLAVWSIRYGNGLFALPTSSDPQFWVSTSGHTAAHTAVMTAANSMLAAASSFTGDLMTLFVLQNGSYQDMIIPATVTTGAIIPEPSTYALLVGVVTFGVIAFRRRNKSRV